MKITGKINNVYKKFYSENKGILELEIDRESFFEAQKAQKEDLIANIEFNFPISKEETVFQAIKEQILELSEHKNINFEEMCNRMIKKYGIYTVVFVRKDCTENLLEFWKTKHPYSQFKIVSGDSILEEVWLYKDIKNYEKNEMYNFIYNLAKECKINGIKCTPETELYAKIGEVNDKY